MIGGISAKIGNVYFPNVSQNVITAKTCSVTRLEGPGAVSPSILNYSVCNPCPQLYEYCLLK